MYWRQNNEIINIKKLSNNRIKSNLDYLYKSDKTYINGYTVPYWILSFKKELDYRKELGDAVIDALPWVKQQVQQELNRTTYNIRYKEEKYKV